MAEKTKWISCVVDVELFNLIDKEYKRRVRTRKDGERSVSKSEVIRIALDAYFRQAQK